MSLQGSDETQIPFHDASAYFSEEEWKLLQEWQKELYRNVMNEIHQALISLGPLIATTVGSVRAKEKEVLQPMDGQYLERRYRINHSPSDTMSNPEVRYRISKGEHLHLNNAHYSEGRKRHDNQTAEFPILSTDIHLRKEEEPASIFIDHIGGEIGESSTDPTLGHPVTTTVVSFRIKDEEETSCSMEHQDSKGLGTTSHSFSDGTTRSRVKLADSVKNPGKTTQCKVLPGRSITTKRLCSETETHYNIQLWSDMNQELEEAEANQCKPGFSGPMHYSMPKGVPDVQTPEKNYELESDASLAHNFTAPPGCTKQKLSLHSSNECENTLNNEYLLGHKATHADVRPYQCIECSKGFSKKANLFVHMRTHTGERPYHCNICDKSFNQRGILTRHQRTHLRERPY